MPYITKSELKSVLYSYQVDDITGGDDTIVQMAINASLEEVKGYLVNVYDVQAEFDKTSNKNALLLEICKDVAVWHLVKLANVDVIYDNVKSRYDRAIAWLDKVRKGSVSTSLPVYTATNPDQDEENSRFRWGSSNKKFNHNF